MSTSRAYSLLLGKSILRTPGLRTTARWHLQASPLSAASSQRAARSHYSTDASNGNSATEPLQPPDYLSEGELQVFNKLKRELDPSKLEVQDISGGCGSMYGLDIVSARFKGMSVIKQHKLVNSVLAEEIKSWHGVQLKTKAP